MGTWFTPILQEALVSSFDYLKTAIRQKGCTLQQVADASGMTKGYLSQLLNAKIKSPSAQKLEALHRVSKKISA